MAEKLICPGCGKPSYTAATSAYLPCPYCSLVFSKKGPTRRKRERMKQEVYFTLSYKGRYISSRTYDVAKDKKVNGLRILIDGNYLLEEGEVLTLDIPELGLRGAKARVVWRTVVEEQKTALGLGLL